MDNQTQSDREPVLINLQIMTCAVVVSWLGMFFVLALDPSATSASEVYESSLFGPIVSLMFFGVGVVVRRRMLARLCAKNSFSSFRDFLLKFFSVHMVSLVLTELAVVILFVKSFEENNSLWIALGSVIGFVVIARDFPTRNRLEHLYKNECSL